MAANVVQLDAGCCAALSHAQYEILDCRRHLRPLRKLDLLRYGHNAFELRTDSSHRQAWDMKSADGHFASAGSILDQRCELGENGHSKWHMTR